MPDQVTAPDTSTAVSTTPIPMDTQSAPITGQLTPPAAAPQAPAQPAAQPAPKAGPGEFMHNLSHAFTGAILGTLAGKEKTTSYQTDDTGKMTPVNAPKTTTDQLRDIARSALMGLAAGSRVPPQKSGLASALAGAGAGADSAIGYGQEQDLLKRKQASEEFERGQQALINKAANAHTAIETLRAVQEISNSTLESQSKFADLGQDSVAAAVAGGNAVPVQDMHMNDLLDYKKEHPEYLNYTPVLTKVAPKEGLDPKEPNAVDRYYSLVDYTKPVEVSQPMIDHLKAVGFPGAENLQAGQKIDPKQFKGLWWQGLKMYNEALRDPKNKDVIDVTSPDGMPMKAVYNKTLNSTEILRDEKGQPLGGKMEVDKTNILGADGKIYTYLYQKSPNGRLLKNLGEAGDTANQLGATYGDMSLTGPEYLKTVPQPYKNNMDLLGHYDMSPQDMGRSSAGRMGLMAGTKQAFPDFDEKNYKERYDYIKQYQTSASGDGASRTRLNTAIGHLDMLAEAADALAQNNVLFFNKVANEFGYQTGTSPKVAYNVIAQKAAGEAAGAVKGGGSAVEAEIDKQEKNFNPDLSPAQQKSAVRETMRLLNTQKETVENNFKQAMGTSSKEFGRPVLAPQNEAIMDKWTAPASPQSGQTPAGMIRIQDSQGGFHNLPSAQLDAAKKRDPNLKVIQ